MGYNNKPRKKCSGVKKAERMIFLKKVSIRSKLGVLLESMVIIIFLKFSGLLLNYLLTYKLKQCVCLHVYLYVHL